MGTLTADLPRLPEYCHHKLPTSCQLTSIPNCCACADERAHSLSYPTYIDGVGYVPRGLRHQRYCWYCREFWDHRIAQTNLLPSQTRIPQVPDQTDFLKRWYEFYDGYRLVTRADGSEERIAVLGEPLRDVSPGQLPRTLDELRAGRDRSELDQRQHIEIVQTDAPSGPSLDEALDLMLEHAEAEDDHSQTDAAMPNASAVPDNTGAPPSSDNHGVTNATTLSNISGNVMNPAPSRNHEYQARRIAALRRELLRMRNGVERVISGLRDLGEAVPDSFQATGQISELGRTLDMFSPVDSVSSHTPLNSESRAPVVGSVYRDPALTDVQQRLNEAQRQLEQAQRFRDQAASESQLARASHTEATEILEGAELDLTEHREQVSRLRREQRTAENYARLFGTREDMENQGAEYESPIGGMFSRAWERFSAAEQVRREERTLRQVLEDERRAPGHASTEHDEEVGLAANTFHEDHLNEYYTMLRRQGWAQNINSQSEREVASNLSSLEASAEQTRGQIDVEPETSTERTVPQQMPLLERLLRNTPEPHRSSIIARMIENGTAEALEESAGGAGYINVWRRLRDANAPFHGRWDEDTESEGEEDLGNRGLDAEGSGRPGAKEDSELVHKLDCKICYTQVADTACLPCGHLVMCQWCSEQHSPVMQHDRTRPQSSANCPVCRKRIKQKVRIYRA